MRGIILASVVAAGPALAETDPASIEFSPIMEMTVKRGVHAAMTSLAITFEDYSSDGETIELSDLGNRASLKNADRRAQKVYGYLAIDLNWDGKVTRDELARVFSTPEQQPFVEGYLTDGELNGDAVISFEEMRQDALLEYPDTDGPSNGYMREIMGWDLNDDGVLHFEEVLAVVIAHQKP